MTRLKVQRIGGSYAVILTDEMVADLKVGEGAELVASRIAGGYEISSDAAEFKRAMEVGREVMSRYRNALRDLAKS